jgi:hypothetical protein
MRSFVAWGTAACLLVAGCGGGGSGSSSGGGNPPANSAPTFLITTFAATEDQDLSATVTASDANGDAITFAANGNPTRGTVTFAANGTFTYHPAANFSGTDAFGVSANDGRGGVTNSTVTLNVAPVNDAPQAADDRVQLAFASTLTVPVLANDVDPDGETLAVTILEPPLVGAASVGINGVSISGLPAGFRGLLRFRYEVRDATALASTAYALVFVDTAPFRAVVPMASGSRVGIGISNFVGEPRLLNAADPAGTIVDSYVPSANGNVVVYHRFDPALAVQRDQLCTVSTTAGAVPACYQIPDELRLHELPPNNDSYVYKVSPNGRWVAVVLTRADLSVAPSLYLIDTTNPTVATQVTPVAGAPHAILPTFSGDSTQLYFIASEFITINGQGVYRVQPGSTAAPMRMSAAPGVTTRVDGLSVSRDQSKLVFQRRGLDPGVYLVATAAPGVEHRLSQPIDLTFDDLQSAAGYPLPADPDLTAVAYVVWRNDGTKHLWHAPVSTAGPAAQSLGWLDPGTMLVMSPQMRPDGRAMLVAYGPTFPSLSVFEYSPEWSGGRAVAAGFSAFYDSTGSDLIPVLNLVPSGFNYIALAAVATRNSSVAPVALGTAGLQQLGAGGPGVTTGSFILVETEIGGSSGVYFRLANPTAPAAILPITTIPPGATGGLLVASIVAG